MNYSVDFRKFGAESSGRGYKVSSLIFRQSDVLQDSCRHVHGILSTIPQAHTRNSLRLAMATPQLILISYTAYFTHGNNRTTPKASKVIANIIKVR